MGRKNKDSGGDTLPPSDQSTPQSATTIVVDYRGFVGKPQTPGSEPGATRFQAQVAHSRSPLILFWPEKGRKELLIHPGINVLDREQWEFYSTKERATAEKLSRGWFRVLTELPNDDYEICNEQNGIIARTVSQSGLDWVEDQAGDSEHIVDAVKARRPYAHPMMFEPAPWAANSGVDERISRDQGGSVHTPSLAM